MTDDFIVEKALIYVDGTTGAAGGVVLPIVGCRESGIMGS